MKLCPKTSGLFYAVAGFVVLASAAGNLQAQYYPLAVNVKMTVRIQTSSTQHGQIDTYKTSVARLGTKEILKLLGAATTNDFTGARLVLDNRTSTNFQVLKGTNVLSDVSRFITMKDSTNWVSSGTVNNRTGVYSLKAYLIRAVSFDNGAGTSFDFSGPATDAFRASAVNGQGQQTFAETVTVDGAGLGQSGGKAAFFTGTMTMSGKAAY